MSVESQLHGSSLQLVYGTSFENPGVGTVDKHSHENESQQTVRAVNDHNSISTKIIPSSQLPSNKLENLSGSNNFSGSRHSELIDKIHEYRLYLEQINNEKTYVIAQLEVFKKQLKPDNHPLGAAELVGLNPSFNNEQGGQLKNLAKPVGHPVDNIGNNIGLFFKNISGDDSVMMNVLFGFLLICIGYMIASRSK